MMQHSITMFIIGAVEKQCQKMLGLRIGNAIGNGASPNCRFNADANMGHAFGIFMAPLKPFWFGSYALRRASPFDAV